MSLKNSEIAALSEKSCKFVPIEQRHEEISSDIVDIFIINNTLKR